MGGAGVREYTSRESSVIILDGSCPARLQGRGYPAAFPPPPPPPPPPQALLFRSVALFVSEH
ncbi:hypothetical protein E2C01_030370 [Portunus trituberculatus]|uniref:Uncharacterized protein n=1 Tax=Portunus trituberculatus TaxID=210409 RepID=A0A5B7ERW3_PORTR|nr:hypothetical protein [Portunus trituberculatus]